MQTATMIGPAIGADLRVDAAAPPIRSLRADPTARPDCRCVSDGFVRVCACGLDGHRAHRTHRDTASDERHTEWRTDSRVTDSKVTDSADIDWFDVMRRDNARAEQARKATKATKATKPPVRSDATDIDWFDVLRGGAR